MDRVFLLWLASACSVLLSRYPMVSAFDYGLAASAGKFPFVVGLYWWEPLLDEKPTTKTIPFCTGTIATVDWVITTQGCAKIPNRFSEIISLTHIYKIKMIAGTAFAPADKDTFLRYNVKTAKDLKLSLPTIDMKEIFNWTKEQAENEYSFYDIHDDINKIEYRRFRLDLALFQTDTPWEISAYVQTAPFPIGFREVIDKWWNTKVNETRYGTGFMEPCYAVGWGGWDEETTQLRMRYAKVRFVPYENCELTYCTECSWCNKSIRVDPRTEACYKTYYPGDACLGDEGAPVWCPWVGTARTSTGKIIKTGAVLGFLSWRATQTTRCTGKSIPSIYVHSWNVYPLMKIANEGAEFPPDLWVYEDSKT